MTIPFLLVLLALMFVVLDAAGKAPLWPAVFCLVLKELLGVWDR